MRTRDGYNPEVLSKDERRVIMWMQTIQELIADASGPVLKKGPFKGHSRTKPKKWLKKLVDMVESVRPKKDEIDENIWMARLMGQILWLWADYVTYAKANDPKRPVKLRQKAIAACVNQASFLLDMTVYKPGIEKVFTKQKWEDPFSRNATDGTFV